MAGEIGDYCGIDFIGGGLGAVDKIDGAVLQDKDHFLVVTPTVFAPLSLDADSGAGENSPQIIAPNTNPGTKRWILAGGVFAGLTLYGNIIMPANGTIGQAAGPLLTFDDGNNFLEITGCDVAVGGAIARTKLHVITTNESAIDWSMMIQNLYSASDMSGTGVGLKLKTYSDSQTEGNLNKWTGIAAESQATPTYGKRVDMVFYTVANAETAAPTEKMRIMGTGKVGVGTLEPDDKVHIVDSDAVNPVTLVVHNTAGSDADSELLLATSATLTTKTVGASILADRTNVGGTGSTDLLFKNSLATTLNTNMIIKADGKCGFGGDVAPAEIIDVTGNVNVTGVYKVDDTQVVSNQGAAVANATDAPTTMARLNDLLARCRAHGLIAT